MSHEKRVYQVVNFARSVPKCFPDAKAYGLWKEACAQTRNITRAGPCMDCTPTYQAAMRTKGKCENTHVHFEMIEGWWEGVVPPTVIRDKRAKNAG